MFSIIGERDVLQMLEKGIANYFYHISRSSWKSCDHIEISPVTSFKI